MTLWLAIGILASAAIIVAALAIRARRRNTPARIVFELALPSKWAAELTSQTLENDAIDSRLAERDGDWLCLVTRSLRLGDPQIESTCRRLDQVASARGGGCKGHLIRRGRTATRFEH